MSVRNAHLTQGDAAQYCLRPECLASPYQSNFMTKLYKMVSANPGDCPVSMPGFSALQPAHKLRALEIFGLDTSNASHMRDVHKEFPECKGAVSTGAPLHGDGMDGTWPALTSAERATFGITHKRKQILESSGEVREPADWELPGSYPDGAGASPAGKKGKAKKAAASTVKERKVKAEKGKPKKKAAKLKPKKKIAKKPKKPAAKPPKTTVELLQFAIHRLGESRKGGSSRAAIKKCVKEVLGKELGNKVLGRALKSGSFAANGARFKNVATITTDTFVRP